MCAAVVQVCEPWEKLRADTEVGVRPIETAEMGLENSLGVSRERHLEFEHADLSPDSEQR